MSDSLPPVPGLVPYEEHHLDAVLSGDTARVPGALRPVAGVMAALRAAPGATELDGEAAARAAYRTFLLPAADQPPGPGGPAARPPGPAAGGGRRLLARPGRHPRHRRRRNRHPVAGLLGVAAALAAVIAITCSLTGLGGNTGRTAGNGQGTPAGTASSRAVQQGVEGGATKVPSPRPTPTVSASTLPAAAAPASSLPVSGPAALCREYLEVLAHPRPPANVTALGTAIERFIAAAGGQGNIGSFCATLTDGQPRSAVPAADPGTAPVLPGLPGGHSGFGPDQGRPATAGRGQQ